MKFKRSQVSLCAFEELSFVSTSFILAKMPWALTHRQSWDNLLCFQEAPRLKEIWGLLCCQKVTERSVVIAASLRFISPFATYLKTQSQKCLWLHTGNQTTMWWLWLFSLAWHKCHADRAFWRALQISSQLGSEQGRWIFDGGHWEGPFQTLRSGPSKLWIGVAVFLIR